ncbi:MAG: YeeE/YedE thiosulfate transporter family protein [Cellvibrionaceae bacterium]|nr:YeeE/YedE thiosulfate transporter family protein [Cellvibrionaceae bacterium]
MTILLAIVLGALFGFVLQRVGATDSKVIWGMLTLKDLRLAKTILFAIGVSSFALFAGMQLGLIDAGHMSVKSAYYGVLIGGLLLGLGWAVAGYCPGTGVAALGEGKRDAVVYVLGGLFGALIYTLVYEKIADTWLFEKIAGGKVTLAGSEKYASLITDISPILIAGIFAAVFVVLAALLPRRLAA